jgi:predicted ATPase
MRIKKIRIDPTVDAVPHSGLKAFTLDRLGDVVLLVGANGAGKTRLLNAVEVAASNFPYNTDSRQLSGNMHQAFQHLRNETTLPDRKRIEGNMDFWAKQLNILQQVDIENFNAESVVRLVPNNTKLSDYRQFTLRDIHSSVSQSSQIGIDHLQNLTLAYVKRVQDRWWNANHQLSSESEEKKAQAAASYESLNGLVLQMLGVELGRDLENDPTLFGRSMPESGLSDGQKILLQYAVIIHSQGAKLGELVLILDEPENHLHPSAVIDAIGRLKNLNKGGQIWIATHSVPLIASLSVENPRVIWFLKDGKAANAGRDPELVMSGLVGDNDQIERLRAFTAFPEILALASFAADCLRPPVTVHHREGDPQESQAAEILSIPESGKHRVLDFGAGKGRILDALISANNGTVPEWLDYIAFDEFPADKEFCEATIIGAYGESSGRYFNKLEDLALHSGSDGFDHIVLSNVLHEVHPSMWHVLFGKNGKLTNLLKSDGKLVVLEVAVLSEGEHAHARGFTVLEANSAEALFDSDQKGFVKIHGSTRNENLLAFEITRAGVETVTNETVTKALAALRNTSKSKIDTIRSQGQLSFRRARELAFWLTQFANASLLLDDVQEQS